MMNPQPLLLLATGLALPLAGALCDGTDEGRPSELELPAGAGLNDWLGTTGCELTGAELGTTGAGTEDTCEECETWDEWLPEPDT